MRDFLHEHPVTSRLFGIGLPGWIGFAAAGWIPGVIIAVVALLAILSWSR